MPKIPQISGPVKNVILILVMGPIGGVALASMGGELHSWSDIPKALNHGAFMSIGIAAGWIFLKSPWAADYQSLTHQSVEVKQVSDGVKVTTEKSETVTVEKSATEEKKHD